ncbi:V-type ATP synthase subunit I [Ruminococcaceae bacterium OttesenSCG-928-I18]|nr:V-type ATP synthase subunit I [Ruminococcaceae bacterium OttesenSCG-928-I18]
MAVLEMEHIELCAMKRDRKQILELLQRRGTVEIRDVEVRDEVFEKADTAASRSLFEKNAETAKHAAEIVYQYTEQKKPGFAFLRGRTPMSWEEHEKFCEKRDDILHTAQRIQLLEREITESKAEISRSEAQEEALLPWLHLPVPQTFTGTKKTAVFVGSLEGELKTGEILELLAKQAPELEAIHVEIVSTSQEQTNLYAIVPVAEAEKAEEALRAIGFSRPSAATHRLPKEKQKRLQEKRTKARQAIDKNVGEICAAADRIEDFHKLEDHMRMRAEKYDAIERLVQSRHTFILEGFVPQKVAKQLHRELEETFECAVDTYHAGYDNTECPTVVENKWFVRPTETILASYSLPNRNEIDPTPIMGIFYYAMFGLMFSDFGYGLIMAGITGFCLLKFRNMDIGWKKNVQLFFWCGVSTMFWGVVFSSYFGDVVDVVAKTFLDRAADAPTLMPPLWFSPLDSPIKLLMFCLAIGVVHLTIGYICKGINCVRNKDTIGLIFDTILPVAVLYPLLLMLLGSSIYEGMMGTRLHLPAYVNTICLAISGVCVLGIVLMAGRESPNPVIRLLKGLYGVYNILAGWLSDILSYSRLLALGLATGVIASVMNQLGTLAGGGFIGIILFVLVFAVGQALNFGINVLGAYVHSNRLEFVEFFGKFYEGGGKVFTPLGIHTKYYKIEEETQNV